ncbi:unnamed protein product [Rotaria sordida]|uniref:F-box domain-containing protein n=1 Tax=Rotaria sordida TaxID=392033 RepID=A0A815NSB7_9BILA|nr:unnamed protein product [Rotaria sordida]CAF1634825.1 unnamed protein product [Rotaria sordida]
MTNKLEILPSEIFLNIFLYFSWDEVLISFWSLNKRINSIICSIFEINKNGIIFNKPGLSYKKFSKILLPLIFNSLSLCSSIKYIHIDGINSIYFHLIYQDIFSHNNKLIYRFPNLKSLYITRCLLYKLLRRESINGCLFGNITRNLSKISANLSNSFTLSIDID